MNKKKIALIVIMLLEALFFGIFTMLYVNGTIKLVAFAASVIVFSIVVNALLVIAIRKFPNN